MEFKLKPNIQALIFDLDGTLADSMPLHYKAWQKVAPLYGFEFPENLFYHWAGRPTESLVPLLNQKFNVNMDVKTVVEQKEGAFRALQHLVKPIEPVVDILKTYAPKLPIGVGTGSERPDAQKTLEILGIDHLVQSLVSVNDVTKPKPDPETFARCAQELGIAPENCLVFEDGDSGLEAAKAAGMETVDIRTKILKNTD